MLEVQKVVIFADSHSYTKLFQNEEFQNFVVVNIDTLTPSTDLNGFFRNGRDAACLCISKTQNYYKILNGHYQPLISKILATLSSLVGRINLSLFIVFDNNREVNQKDVFIQEIEEKQPIFKNLGRCYGIDSMWFGMDAENTKDKIYDGKQTNSFQWLDPSSGPLGGGSGSGTSKLKVILLCAILFLLLGIVTRLAVGQDGAHNSSLLWQGKWSQCQVDKKEMGDSIDECIILANTTQHALQLCNSGLDDKEAFYKKNRKADNETIYELENASKIDKEKISGLENASKIDKEKISGLEDTIKINNKTISGLENASKIDKEKISGLENTIIIQQNDVERWKATANSADLKNAFLEKEKIELIKQLAALQESELLKELKDCKSGLETCNQLLASDPSKTNPSSWDFWSNFWNPTNNK
ncbi:hypothetical protein DFA_03125 [Cavenderia fasciculata]|uniref:Uncharacterized protein n=1 Tax=Cavenderia fasciculata TaxID=261658 RepID=F4PGP6_CACFS|nr:uncharacterized protein DFA_03125 [Cavenderia fasciculata]EGG24880.1 hypothetical protein DFA_03125 [Cavenderia fasciculata]|eukprot:XP_004362731.1 hypothetical protein DFA_03125 [Cavenderia fasciculata]